MEFPPTPQKASTTTLGLPSEKIFSVIFLKENMHEYYISMEMGRGKVNHAYRAMDSGVTSNQELSVSHTPSSKRLKSLYLWVQYL